MRALLTLVIVLSCGAAAMVIASRASTAVDAKTGGAAAVAGDASLRSLVLDLCVAGGATHTVEMTTSGLLKFGAGQSLKLRDADIAEIQAAAAAVPSRLWRASVDGDAALTQFNERKAAGGDFYQATFGEARKAHARADGWRASDLDGIKEAIWRVIRRRKQPKIETDPKKKTSKGVEFVEPYETLRNALRIKF